MLVAGSEDGKGIGCVDRYAFEQPGEMIAADPTAERESDDGQGLALVNAKGAFEQLAQPPG